MRIRSAKIDSFGAFRDRRFDFGPGVTVVYGRNEAGKTTLMEFIRSTMFPGRKKRYPSSSKTDSGTLFLETDSGQSMEIIREANKTREAGGGPLPKDITHLDDSVYYSVFAMTPADLRDSEVISSGDIRRRFVIVPGGESIQPVLSGISEEMSDHMSAERRGNRKIHRKIDDIMELDIEINKSPSVGTEYTELFTERSSLESRLSELTKEEESYSRQRAAANLEASQRKNVENLGTLRSERGSLTASESVRDDDRSVYSRLKSSVEEKNSVLKDRTEAEGRSLASFAGMNPEAFSPFGDKIRELAGKRGTYSELESRSVRISESAKADSENIALNRTDGSAKDARPVSVSRFVILMIGLVMIAAGLPTSFYVSVAGIVLFAAGTVFAFRRKSAVAEAHPDTAVTDRIRRNREELEGIEERMSAMRRELDSVADTVRIPRSSFEADVKFLSEMSDRSAEHARMRRETSDSVRALRDSESEFRAFISRFGTEERFLELEKQSVRRKELDAMISALDAGIKASGYGQSDVPADVPSEAETASRRSELSQRIGYLSSEMKSIADDDHTESLLNERASCRSDLESMARRWAVLSAAYAIANRACDEIYSSAKPGVVACADRYIGSMTGGRYSLCSDLRESDITVTSADGRKNEDRWSSGLGDQVKLSLKMAVARELSSEKLPILLDDVLLMFDSDRKRGACRALLDLSEDMQVLLFTCDAETRDMMAEESSGTAGIVVLD